MRGNESETVYFETPCFLLRNFLSGVDSNET